MKNNKWEIIHDADNEDGTPTCWVKEIYHSRYGRFVWISKTKEGFAVEVKRDDEFSVLVNCKTLTSAKRWVSTNF